MNRFPVNSAVFNGRALAGVLLASAALTATAGVVALGVPLSFVSAAVVGTGQVQGAATLARPGQGVLVGQATLSGLATKTHDSSAGLTGTAEVQASVRRDVWGLSVFTGQAVLAAIPASTLGEAVSVATAVLTGEAVRTQRGAASSQSTAMLTGTGQAVRQAQAVILGAAGVYAETDFSNAALVGVATLTPVGVRCVPGAGAVPSSAHVVATGYITSYFYHYAEVAPTCAATLWPIGSATQFISASGSAEAGLAATALRNVQPTAAPLAVAGLVGRLQQLHQAYAQGVAVGALRPLGVRTLQAQNVAGATATVAAGGVRILRPTVAPTSTAVLNATPDPVTRAGAATLNATGTVMAGGVRTVRPSLVLVATAGVVGDVTHFATNSAYGVLRATGVLAATATHLPATWASAVLLATSTVAAEASHYPATWAGALAAASGTLASLPTRIARVMAVVPATAWSAAQATRMPLATVGLAGQATLRASGYMNVEVDDPSTCVFKRSASDTDFARSRVETDFVRMTCA